jgi:hypothetical protein
VPIVALRHNHTVMLSEVTKKGCDTNCDNLAKTHKHLVRTAKSAFYPMKSMVFASFVKREDTP